MKKKSYVHDVEINFGDSSGDKKNWLLKIDGKEFGSTCGVIIKSPMANEDGMTTVEIKFYADVKGRLLVDKITKGVMGIARKTNDKPRR